MYCHTSLTDAEEEFVKRNSYTPVMQLFEKYKKTHPESPKMNYENVRNHLMVHYAEQESRIWKKEYMERVSGIINCKISIDNKFEGMMAILEDQLFTIASNPTLDVLKKSDTITKLVKQISEVIATQAKLRGEMKSVHLVFEKMTGIWFHIADRMKDNPEAHQAVLNGIDMFQGEMENINLLDKE